MSMSLLLIVFTVVLLAVGPVLGVFALICATVRTVRIEPEAGMVAVTRRLLGLSWTRRWRLERFQAVVVTMSIWRPKHAVSDGTIAGDQRYMSYDVALVGRTRIRLTHFRDAATPAAGCTHQRVIPTRSEPRPRSKTSSVRLGHRETMRMRPAQAKVPRP